MNNNDYKGSKGSAYLLQRDAATSIRNQKLRASIFADLEVSGKTVLDFGCGTGGILSLLPCSKRIGVEIGEAASQKASTKGIQIYESLERIEANSIDVAISFHALEHVDNPVEIMTELRRVLRPGGIVRIVVPCETPLHRKERRWTNNHDHHLYTWTPLLIGNLAMRVKFAEINTYIRSMPTGSRFGKLISTQNTLGRRLHLAHSFWHDRLNTVLDAKKPLE